jgi:hypothetical protein
MLILLMQAISQGRQPIRLPDQANYEMRTMKSQARLVKQMREPPLRLPSLMCYQ